MEVREEERGKWKENKPGEKKDHKNSWQGRKGWRKGGTESEGETKIETEKI